MPAGERFDGFINVLNDGEDAGIFFAEIRDDAFDGRQNDEQISREQRGDEGGELVVIAELQFGERDDVVFVDNGNNATVEERNEGVAGIEVAFVVFEIIMSKEDLGNGEAMSGKELVVGGHEPGLTDGGAGLEFGEVGRTFAVAEDAHAGANGTGGDEQDFLAGFATGGDLGDQLLHLGEVGSFPGIREDTGPDLHHNPENVFQQRGAHQVFGNRGGVECRAL